MKHLVLSIFAGFFALGAAVANAGECVIGDNMSLEQALNEAKSGGCVSDLAFYRDRYNDFFPGTTQFHVIKWDASQEVTGDIPQLESNSDKPLVLIAGSAATVKIKGGSHPLILKNRVVIDHLTVEGFSKSAIAMQGERSAIFKSRIISNGENGILVTGKDNRIVDSEIASNGFNGILVGGGNAGKSCSAQQSDAGKGTIIEGSSIHDNGNQISGSSCSDVDNVDSVGACWSLKLETETCFDLLAEEAPCDEPSVPPDDACGNFWNSRHRCEDLWSKASIPENASKDDAVAKVFDYFVGAHGGSGVVVDASNVKIISFEGDSQFNGRIYDNRSHGVYVNTLSNSAICKEASARLDVNTLQTALISETPVDDLFVSRYPLPSITQLAASEGSDGISVAGTVNLSEEPWYPWNAHTVNMGALRAEIFIKNGDDMTFVGSGSVDSSGRFVVNVGNQSNPVFVATLVDTEHGNTSPLAQNQGATPEGDDDNDGLPNDQEDLNHNGQVDLGETDPINPDTDGDGLLDGEEKLHNGRLAALIANGYLFADLNKLDPLNPDSDGDCLPDGLELGTSKEQTESLIARMPSKPHLVVSEQCQAILRDHTITIFENVIKFNETAPATVENIAMLFDADPETISDPTSVDTDNDGMRDGYEDFNFNGKRDSTDNEDGTVTSKETDPAIADSDGDGLPDGEEGDEDKDGRLGPDESDPILADTDGDGVSDGQEKRTGTYPNGCDSDEDGLSDGVEVGAIRPASEGGACHGLEAAGTNYQNPHEMDPLNPDSDGDGLMDGVEDANGNGWIESTESDPSVADTDRDDLVDGVEARGDFDGDGVPDFDLRLINAGPKCSPPPDISDVDCDGIPNAIDVDSDDDGCPDSQEGGWIDQNVNGLPDVYDNEAKGCGEGGGGGSFGGGGSESPEQQGQTTAQTPWWLRDQSGGGACSLTKNVNPDTSTAVLSFIAYLVVISILLTHRKKSVII